MHTLLLFISGTTDVCREHLRTSTREIETLLGFLEVSHRDPGQIMNFLLPNTMLISWYKLPQNSQNPQFQVNTIISTFHVIPRDQRHTGTFLISAEQLQLILGLLELTLQAEAHSRKCVCVRVCVCVCVCVLNELVSLYFQLFLKT